jgi:hypothetical protein
VTAPIIEEEIADDPSNDPTHPIPYLHVLDVAAYRQGGACLTIVVASPLRDDERSQTRLLDKIQGYLSHIQSDQFLLDAGTRPSPENTTISVVLHPESALAVRDLLMRCDEWVRSQGARLEVRDLDLAAGV